MWCYNTNGESKLRSSYRKKNDPRCVYTELVQLTMFKRMHYFLFTTLMSDQQPWLIELHTSYQLSLNFSSGHTAVFAVPCKFTLKFCENGIPQGPTCRSTKLHMHTHEWLGFVCGHKYHYYLCICFGRCLLWCFFLWCLMVCVCVSHPKFEGCIHIRFGEHNPIILFRYTRRFQKN